MRKVEFPGISLFKNRTRYEIFWGIISWKSTSNLFAWTARQAESEVGVQHWRIINLVEELCSWKSYSICMQINSAVDSEHMQLLGLHDSIRYNKIVYDSLPGPSAGLRFLLLHSEVDFQDSHWALAIIFQWPMRHLHLYTAVTNASALRWEMIRPPHAAKR